MPRKTILAVLLILISFHISWSSSSIYSFPILQLHPSGLPANLEFNEVTAHRGNRIKLRENSLSSLLNAMDIHSSSVEFDVHLTKDGVPVIYHDYSLNPDDFKNLPQKTLIKDLTFVQLKTLTFSNNLQTLEGDATLPSLEEFLLAIRQRERQKQTTIPLHLEIKSEKSHLHESAPIEDLAKNIAKVISEIQIKTPLIVRAFNWDVINLFMQIRPDIPRVLLVDKKEFKDIPIESTINKYKPLGISPHHQDLTFENIKPWLQFGVQINPWTVNSLEQAKKLIEMGVTGLTTDDPELFLQHFTKNIQTHQCFKNYLSSRKSSP